MSDSQSMVTCNTGRSAQIKPGMKDDFSKQGASVQEEVTVAWFESCPDPMCHTEPLLSAAWSLEDSSRP